VKALALLAEQGTSGESYNLCTGKAWTMKESLDMLIDISGVEVDIQTDPSLFRPSDEKLLLGDPSKIHSLGWKAVIPFETTLNDIFENWLKRLSK